MNLNADHTTQQLKWLKQHCPTPRGKGRLEGEGALHFSIAGIFGDSGQMAAKTKGETHLM